MAPNSTVKRKGVKARSPLVSLGNTLLTSCFTCKPNKSLRVPSSRRITTPPNGNSFESRAFAALIQNATKLGIKSLWRCSAARMDGYLETTKGEIILLEMKESLRWGSTQSAGFQFLAGRQLLGLEAEHGIIVFERWSGEWGRTKPYGAWGQLALHANEFAQHIKIGGLQILKNKAVRSFAKCVP